MKSVEIEYRAQPPRPPRTTSHILKLRAERALYIEQRESTESRSVARGLLLLALLALVVSFALAGIHRVFFTGWWQHW